MNLWIISNKYTGFYLSIPILSSPSIHSLIHILYLNLYALLYPYLFLGSWGSTAVFFQHDALALNESKYFQWHSEILPCSFTSATVMLISVGCICLASLFWCSQSSFRDGHAAFCTPKIQSSHPSANSKKLVIRKSHLLRFRATLPKIHIVRRLEGWYITLRSLVGIDAIGDDKRM